MPKSARTTLSAEVPVAGPRQPCPCGSGKRYKACHGKRRHGADRAFVARPFEGLPAETDWIALREIVSAATAPVRLAAPHADRTVLVATLLPMAAPALVKADGQIMLGLQTTSSGTDPSVELARSLLTALDAEPGTTVSANALVADAPRLQALVDRSAPFPVTVHETFDFWLEPSDSPGSDVGPAVEDANSGILPTSRLASVDAAYWCRIADRDQLRWVMPHDEEPLLDALARLHAQGADGLGSGTRLLGTFRGLGRLVPVWDLAPGTPVDAVEEPASALASRLDEVLARVDPLTVDERRARSGLANRQVTIR
ncbi:MAG TPA: DUF5926 family protein [Jiangellaceae bacterium]|nr:DUF5926 family protein [Jiangellaceae bacterium]